MATSSFHVYHNYLLNSSNHCDLVSYYFSNDFV